MEESSMTNGNGITREIVAKLWNLCNVLRDDGITYTDYVTELTFLLFLKMLAETGHEERLPKEIESRRHNFFEGQFTYHVAIDILPDGSPALVWSGFFRHRRN
jgi:type I restriction-modification system DNA methylase subunit